MTTNTKGFLRQVIVELQAAGIKAWVFGGWAEEIVQLIEPRSHKDIDLLYPEESFDLLDMAIAKNPLWEEIEGKHFPHKRAFNYKGVMVELFLLQSDKERFYTMFWGTKRFDWPQDVLSSFDGFDVASESSLKVYRNKHQQFSN